MSKNRILQPDFKLSFLLPKYWLIWLTVIILYSISWLPYKWQLILGRVIGRLIYKIGLQRTEVAKRNLALCFPDMLENERETLLKRNFENAGIALFETGMGWWWPDWRIKRIFTINGAENINKTLAEGKGMLCLSMHQLSTEIACRCIGNVQPMVVFYRPHNNPLMEFFQFRGRGRANNYMLGKHDAKELLRALKNGETCLYLPDQDYGLNRSLFVPFFNVQEAATTTATLMFAKQRNANTHFVYPLRNNDDSGYTLNISPVLNDFPSGDNEADLCRVNQLIENAIRKAPEQYMWLHRRFKTRPNKDDKSLYR